MLHPPQCLRNHAGSIIHEHKIGLTWHCPSMVQVFSSWSKAEGSYQWSIIWSTSHFVRCTHRAPCWALFSSIYIYVRSLPSIVKNLGFKTSIYVDDSNARLHFSLHFQYYNIMVRIPELIEEITFRMHICSFLEILF